MISMTHLTRLARVASLALALSAWNCSLWPSDPIAKQGGGSDTETLTGVVRLADGAAAARVAVKLLPADYDPTHPDPDSLRTTVTDDTGGFVFRHIDSNQVYNVIAGQASARSWAYFKGVHPKDCKPVPLSLSRATTFMVSLEYQSYQKKDSGLAYFPGTDILVRCNGVTPSKVDSVPQGVDHVIIESQAGWKHDSTFVIYVDSLDLKADENGITCLQ